MTKPDAKSTSAPLLIACFAIRKAIGPCGKISRANFNASSKADPSDATLMRPMDSAALFVRTRPVNTSSLALGIPITRGRRCVPPALISINC